jgi:hypothetical protein
MTRLTAEDIARKNAASRAAWGNGLVSPEHIAQRQREPGKPARTKYRSVSTVVDGERFDSKLEEGIWQDLKLREKAGEIRNLRRQVRFSLFMNGGEHFGIYTADFVYEIFLDRGVLGRWHRYVADAKSAHTRKLQAWQKVRKLMLACHSINVLELP